MRDLEIRGAGNLLGVKQSGHIAALGFDLYCQLLAEAVEELKASSPSVSLEERGIEPVLSSSKDEGVIKEGVIASRSCEPKAWQAAKQSPNISLPLDAHIPEEYVSNLNTRLSLYHRLARVEHIEEVEGMARELEDRFGPLPEPVENLLYIVKIKVLAVRAKVSSISTQGRQIVIKPHTDSRQLTAISSVDAAVKIGPTQIKLDTRLMGKRWKVVLEEILNCNCV
jgi:transcription-repair coupling factor (superfamily II helicase)